MSRSGSSSTSRMSPECGHGLSYRPVPPPPPPPPPPALRLRSSRRLRSTARSASSFSCAAAVFFCSSLDAARAFDDLRIEHRRDLLQRRRVAVLPTSGSSSDMARASSGGPALGSVSSMASRMRLASLARACHGQVRRRELALEIVARLHARSAAGRRAEPRACCSSSLTGGGRCGRLHRRLRRNLHDHHLPGRERGVTGSDSCATGATGAGATACGAGAGRRRRRMR